MSPFGHLAGLRRADRARDAAWRTQQRVERLERERTDLRRILAALDEGVLAVDDAGVVIHANPAAIHLLDMDANACLGQHMFVAVGNPEACRLVEDVMRGEQSRSGEVTVQRGDGELTLVLVVRPLRASGGVGGDAEGALAVVRDVSELRRLERSRQDFFGNVSHELKTPVTAIRGAIETILDDPQMPADVRERFLDGARRHTARLSSLIADLLSLARLESGPRALERGVVDLGTLVGEVLAASEAVAEERGIVLELCVGSVDGAPTFQVDGDEEALRQALGNLVDNAVGHSDDHAAVRVTLEAHGGVVEVRVADRGPGIPQEARERVFERFFRVDADRSRARGGTGIGLSIVKHVAQAHGGSASVESEVGVGSTFTLRLPVSPAPGRGTPSVR